METAPASHNNETMPSTVPPLPDDDEVPDRESAERLLAEWKRVFLEINSAYRPSGVLPIAAGVFMGLERCSERPRDSWPEPLLR